MELTQKEEILRDAIIARGYLRGHPSSSIDYAARCVSCVLDNNGGMVDYELRPDGLYICHSMVGMDGQTRYMARIVSWVAIAQAKFDLVDHTRGKLHDELYYKLYGNG